MTEREYGSFVAGMLLAVGLAVLSVWAATGCLADVAIKPVAPVNPVITDIDAGETDDCGRAGARMARLQCRDSEGAPLWQTPDGMSFADACRYAAADGRYWGQHCLQLLTSCEPGTIGAAFHTAEFERCP